MRSWAMRELSVRMFFFQFLDNQLIVVLIADKLVSVVVDADMNTVKEGVVVDFSSLLSEKRSAWRSQL